VRSGIETVLAVPTEIARVRPPLRINWSTSSAAWIYDLSNTVDIVDLAREQYLEIVR